MADKQTLANFVDGAFVPPAEGGYTDVVNPATGEVYAAAPLSTAPDLDAAFAAAERAFGEWGRTTPGERQAALLAMADAIEQNGERLVAAEAENTGKPIGLTRTEEIPPMVDQIRFFAGAARLLEGRSAGVASRQAGNAAAAAAIAASTSAGPESGEVA